MTGRRWSPTAAHPSRGGRRNGRARRHRSVQARLLLGALGCCWLVAGQDSCEYTPQDCDPGHEWARALNGSWGCHQCSAGKQASGRAGERCESCAHSLEIVPVDGQLYGSGCRCKAHYLNSWTGLYNTTWAELSTECVACSKIERDEDADYRQVSCEPCADASPGKETGCIGRATCECTGGTQGQALVCPAEGYFLIVDHGSELDVAKHRAVIARTVGASRPGSIELEEERAFLKRAYKLYECPDTGLTKETSRCRHWRECLPENERALENATCTPQLRHIDGYSEYWSNECCSEGYKGPLCEFCESPRVKYDGACLECNGTDWQKLGIALIGCVFFVLFIMHNSVATFEEASGKSAITFFFMQTMALLLTERKAEVAGLVNTMNLNFVKPGTFGAPENCVIDGDFYVQWSFGMLAMPFVLSVVYSVVIFIAYVTSESETLHKVANVKLKHYRSARIIDNVLESQHLFSHLPPEDRHQVATEMTIRSVPEGEDVVHEGDDGDEFFVVVSGSCMIKIQGVQLGVKGVLNPGECFGEASLIHNQPRSATVTTVTDCDLGVLSKDAFQTLEERFKHHEKFSQQLQNLKTRHNDNTRESMIKLIEEEEALEAKGDKDGGLLGEMEELEEQDQERTGQKSFGTTGGVRTVQRRETSKRLQDEEYSNHAKRFFVSTYSKTQQKTKEDEEEAAERQMAERQVNTQCCNGCCYKFGHALVRHPCVASSSPGSNRDRCCCSTVSRGSPSATFTWRATTRRRGNARSWKYRLPSTAR